MLVIAGKIRGWQNRRPSSSQCCSRTIRLHVLNTANASTSTSPQVNGARHPPIVSLPTKVIGQLLTDTPTHHLYDMGRSQTIKRFLVTPQNVLQRPRPHPQIQFLTINRTAKRGPTSAQATGFYTMYEVDSPRHKCHFKLICKKETCSL